MPGNIRRADKPEDFMRFGIDPSQIQTFEDAQRVGVVSGSFEWWYFDALLENGASVVVIFFTKPLTHPGLPDLTPVMSVKVVLPGATTAAGGDPRPYAKADFKAVPGQIGVAISNNVFSGDLAHYSVEADVQQGVAVKMTIDRSGPAARIGTGHLLFEEGGNDNFLGWVIPVPVGTAEVTYTVNGVSATSKGTCYHDHNWGDRPVSELVHHWYWGRASVEGLTFSVAHLVCQAAYASTEHTDIVLLENGTMVACGSKHASYSPSEAALDPVTQKPVFHVLTFTYAHGNVIYEVTFKQQSTPVAKVLPGGAAYHRFDGECTVIVDRGQGPKILPVVKTHWEMMWFGNTVPPKSATASSLADAVAAMDFYVANMAEPRR